MIQEVNEKYSLLSEDVVEGMEIGSHEYLIINIHFLLSRYFEHLNGQTFLDGMKFKFVDPEKIGKEEFEINWEKSQVTMDNKDLQSYKFDKDNTNTNFIFSIKEK